MSRLRFTRRLLVVLAVVLVLPVSTGGADDLEARPLHELAEVFPLPKAKQDFAIDLAVHAGGAVIGQAHLEAKAERLPGGEALHWHTRESILTGEGEEVWRTAAELWLDATLEPVRGRLEEGDGADPLVHAFERKGDTFHVEVSGDGRRAMKREAAREGHVLTGLAALVLLARQVADEPRVLEARAFDPDWNYLVAEQPFAALRLEAGPGRWQDRAAWRLHVTSPVDDRQATVILDPESKDVLYIHYKPADEPALDLRPMDVPGGDEAADDVLDVPAKTARAAALRTTLAFLTRDKDLFAEVVHWPRLQELGKSYVRGNVTPEKFKEAILGQFERNTPPPMPVGDARKRILEAKDGFAVEEQGETNAVVTLPETISPMKMTVEKIDGVWYLVRLPHG